MEVNVNKKILLYSVILSCILFFFVRDGQCETNNITMSPLGVYKQTYLSWKDALENKNINGTTFIGTVPGNGMEDTLHIGDTIHFNFWIINQSNSILTDSLSIECETFDFNKANFSSSAILS